MSITRYMKNFFRYKNLLFELVKKNIKLKYRRSYLGILWTLIEPLLTMMVLTLVFGTFFGNDDPQYPVYILCGRLLYTFFSSASKAGLKSISGNAAMKKESICTKIYLCFIIRDLKLCNISDLFDRFSRSRSGIKGRTVFLYYSGNRTTSDPICIYIRTWYDLGNVECIFS